jgi:hypothetical protein
MREGGEDGARHMEIAERRGGCDVEGGEEESTEAMQ